MTDPIGIILAYALVLVATWIGMAWAARETSKIHEDVKRDESIPDRPTWTPRRVGE